MLGSQIPSFTLSFFDENGNESCAFCPPDEDSDDIDKESSDDLHLDDEVVPSATTYWVKISSQDKHLTVDVDIGDTSCPLYPISKVYCASFLLM